MALELLAGAFLGAAVNELLLVVKDVRSKISSFQPVLKRLESTLTTIAPRLNEITLLNQQLKQSGTGIADLTVIVRNGKDLVVKSSKIHHLNYVKKVQYSKLLLDLDNNLLRYFATVLSLDQFKDTREILILLKELHCKQFPEQTTGFRANSDTIEAALEMKLELKEEITTRSFDKNDLCIDSKGEGGSVKFDDKDNEMAQVVTDSICGVQESPQKEFAENEESGSETEDFDDLSDPFPEEAVSDYQEESSGNALSAIIQRQLTYAEVLSITTNFDFELHKGVFGKVYLGRLDKKRVVKMLYEDDEQFGSKAESLLDVHHPNLVDLIAYCDEGDKQGLIYENDYSVHIRSLLSDEFDFYFSWASRLRLVVNAAQGLEYLHNGCNPPIIHGNVNSRKIRWGTDGDTKLGGIRVSKFYPANAPLKFTVFDGTNDYLNNNNSMTFNVDKRGDVFSFGIVLLEVITGKEPKSESFEPNILYKWVKKMLVVRQKHFTDVVDPRLNKDYDIDSMSKAVSLALQCVSATKSKRPDMSQVVSDLRSCFEMETARLS